MLIKPLPPQHMRMITLQIGLALVEIKLKHNALNDKTYLTNRDGMFRAVVLKAKKQCLHVKLIHAILAKNSSLLQ